MAATIVAAGNGLLTVIEEDIEVSVAPGKSAVVASNNALAAPIRLQFGDFGGDATVSTANLGIDYTAGRRRASLGRRSKISSRIRHGVGLRLQ